MSRSALVSTPSATVCKPMSLHTLVIEATSFCFTVCRSTPRISVMSSLTMSGSSRAKLESPA